MSLQFDVIVGNPPYQDGTGAKSTGLPGSKKNLYTQFIHLCIDLLKPDGYLAYVTPPGFLKTTKVGKKSDTLKLMQSLNLKYLNFDEAKHFPTVSLPCITSFVLQKTDKYDNTEVGDCSLDLRSLDIVPLNCTADIVAKLDKIISPQPTLGFVRDDALKVVSRCQANNQPFVTIPQIGPKKLECAMNDIIRNSKGKNKPIHVMVCDNTEHAKKVCDIIKSDDMTFLNSHVRYGDANVYPGIINHINAV